MDTQGLPELPLGWRWSGLANDMMSWLNPKVFKPYWCGESLEEFADATWILHRQYILPSTAQVQVVDEDHFTHFQLAPSAEWRRVRWSELAAVKNSDLSGPILDNGYAPPPCFRWDACMGYRDGPLLDPALKGHESETYLGTEGSLDEADLADLLELLVNSTQSEQAFGCFSYADADSYIQKEDPHLSALAGFSFKVANLLNDMKNSSENYLTPEFWWPEDHSWLVWTDFDLTATRVFGEKNLVESLRNHPDLETLEWEPSQAPDSLEKS